MAGEIEETFGINFQGDSIHSGSISFGRFENEPLSWERRSSFSHNSYLEEVEKCSKPGSVIKKKAYFEAHFKKKGLLGFNIPASHDGSDQTTTSENDGSERISNQEDFESSENVHGVQFDRRSQEHFEPIEDGQYVQFDQRSLEDFVPIVDGHYGQYEQRSFEDFGPDEDGNHGLFDEVPADSDYNGEYGVNGYEREALVTEGPRVSSSNQHMEVTVNNYNVSEDAIDNNRIWDEAPKPENETSSTISVDDTMVVEVKRDHDDSVNNDESLRTMNVTEPVRGVEQAALNDPTSPSPKETKPEHGLSSVVNRVQVWKNSSARSSEGLERNSSRESPRKTNVGKNLSKLATPRTHSVSRTPKEVSKSEGKVTCERKSEKVMGRTKAAESQPSVLKANSRGVQEAKRVNPIVNSSSTNSQARLRAAAFNFKSGERAERRKEFYMKLEENMHAKEDMNHMKAISKEKTEAEIRKLRKSLNFKATPMPSFYRTASASASYGNKAVSDNNKSKKVQNKPKSAGSISGAAVSSNLKTRSRNDQAADECVTSAKPHSTASSEVSVTSPSPMANQSRVVDSKQTAGFPEGRNEQRPRGKTRVSESSFKEARRPNSREKRTGQTPKHSTETTARKNDSVRSIDVRSSSRIGSLTGRVAS